jgi:hypothetical protein
LVGRDRGKNRHGSEEDAMHMAVIYVSQDAPEFYYITYYLKAAALLLTVLERQ